MTPQEYASNNLIKVYQTYSLGFFLSLRIVDLPLQLPHSEQTTCKR